MTPRHRRPFPSGRGIAVTAGVTTALVAFLPAASAAPGMHPDWEPVVAGAETDEPQGSMSRLSGGSTRVAGPADPDLDTMSSAPADTGTDDGYGSSDPDQDPAAPDRSAPRAGTSSTLASSGIPSTAMDAYTAAAEANADCGISWTLIAAIGRVESNHGRFAGATLHTDGLSSPPIIGIPLTGSGGTARITDSDGGRLDGDTVHDRAVGPMQFIPTTWAIYGTDGNGDGRRDPFNIDDAAAAAGKYLCAAGKDLATPAGQARAVFAYNHSDSYVASVLSLAATYAGTTPPRVPTPAGPAPALPEPPVSAADRPPVEAPQLPAPVPPPPVVEHPAPEQPPVDEPPVVEQPAPEPPLVEQPAPEPPVVEQPAPESPAEESPVEEPPVVEQPAPEQPDPEPPVEQPPVEQPPVEEPAPAPTPCETADQPAAALTVDVVDGTGSPETAAEVVARLTDGGLTIGEARDSADGAVSGIAHPESAAAEARSLAEALGLADLLRVEPVERITVVLGSTDAAALIEAVRAFTGMPCPAAEPAAEEEAVTTEETAPAQPATTEPVTTEPATTEAAATETAPTEPAATESVTAPATATEPAGANG